MEKISQKDIDWLLNDPLSQPSVHQSVIPKKKKRWGVRFLSWVLLALGLTVLPFFLLIRLSVYLNLTHQWNGWVSLIAGIGVAIILLLIYLVFLFRRVKNKKLLFRFSMGGAGALVTGFCLYGLMYLSSVNAKNENIKDVYRSLHPILRVAVATTTLADGDLVITDISRVPEDYQQMGLRTNQRSLHFEQQDGYVHAIDLRTIGRNDIRNTLLEFSLKTMGLQTIRHTGTADHLHIALPLSE